MEKISVATLNFIETHAHEDVRKLALQAGKYTDVDMMTAITQISGRQVAEQKIPLWHEIISIRYPKHLSLEQCSSQQTAIYKSTLVEGDTLTDLTGGFGVDCSFLSRRFNSVNYVEQQAELCEIASNNFPALGLNHIKVNHADSVDYLKQMEPVSWIFIDPARRDRKGGKTVVIADCEPDVEQLEELLTDKADKVMIKLSPMLDLSLALNTLKYVEQVHIISVNNECKELLLILNKNKREVDIPIHCINLTNTATEAYCFKRDEEQQSTCGYAQQLNKYLYEPNASIMKGGAFKSIASRFTVEKLHPNSHLYTSSKLVDNFPGRIFEITDSCSFNKKEMKEKLGSINKANITVRNFPATVAELRKRTKLTDGGDIYLFATTLSSEEKIMAICRKPKLK